MQFEGIQVGGLCINSRENLVIKDLPDELLVNFFSYLNVNELSTNVMVSKKFKQITVKAAANEQLKILKNLINNFIQHLKPDRYELEISELNLFLNTQYLSRAVNLIDLKKDLCHSYFLLAKILKNIPHDDLQIENLLPIQDLKVFPLFNRFVAYLSLLKLEMNVVKEQDNIAKIYLLKEAALAAVYLNFPDQALVFLQNLKDVTLNSEVDPRYVSWIKDSIRSLAITPLLAKSEFSIAEGIIKEIKAPTLQTECEFQLNLYKSFLDKTNYDLFSELDDLLEAHNNITDEIEKLKQTLINQQDENGIFGKFLKELNSDMNPTYIEYVIADVRKFIDNLSPESQGVFNNIFDLAMFCRTKWLESIESLNGILAFLSAKNLFNSAVEIITHKANFQEQHRLRWDLFFLMDLDIGRFTKDHLDKIVNATFPWEKRDTLFISIMESFIKQGYFTQAMSLAREYDQKFVGPQNEMQERCKMLIEKFKSL